MNSSNDRVRVMISWEFLGVVIYLNLARYHCQVEPTELRLWLLFPRHRRLAFPCRTPLWWTLLRFLCWFQSNLFLRCAESRPHNSTPANVQRKIEQQSNFFRIYTESILTRLLGNVPSLSIALTWVTLVPIGSPSSTVSCSLSVNNGISSLTSSNMMNTVASDASCCAPLF